MVLLPRWEEEEERRRRQNWDGKREGGEEGRGIESLGKVDFEELLVEMLLELCFEGFFSLPADLIALFELQVVHLEFDRFDPQFWED